MGSSDKSLALNDNLYRHKYPENTIMHLNLISLIHMVSLFAKYCNKIIGIFIIKTDILCLMFNLI